MAKNYFLFFLLIFSSFSASWAQDSFMPDSDVVHPLPFQKGEVLEYKIIYGLFAVGKAQINVFQNTYKVNERNCYRIEVRGKTSGAVDWVAKVDDTWGAYLDSLTVYPLMGYRRIRESSYRKDEMTRFDYANSLIELKELNQKTGEMKEPKIFQFMEPVFDLVSGYAFLRSQDYDAASVGDTLAVPGVLEDEFYTLQILYQGTEPVKTKLGYINCHKLVPIIPENKLFDGENSVTLWLSADRNKIPVKTEARMFIGNAACELIGHKNLLEPMEILPKVKL